MPRVKKAPARKQVAKKAVAPPPVVETKKKRKRRSKAQLIKSVLKEQKNTKHIISHAGMRRHMVENTPQEFQQLRMSRGACDVLQEWLEQTLVSNFREANELAQNNKRQAIRPKEFAMVSRHLL